MGIHIELAVKHDYKVVSTIRDCQILVNDPLVGGDRLACLDLLGVVSVPL